MRENSKKKNDLNQPASIYWKRVNNINDSAVREGFKNGKETHVWYTTIYDYIDFYKHLSVDEKKRASKFRFFNDQQRYIKSHGFLRYILSTYLNCEPSEIRYQTSRYGKPYISGLDGGKPIHFNMSHSKDIVCYILSLNYEVGIDVEYIESDFDWNSIANYSFSLKEIDFLKSLPKNQQLTTFFTLWTRKEALVKANGNSIDELKNFNNIANRFKGQYQINSFVCREGYQGAFATNHINSLIHYYHY